MYMHHHFLILFRLLLSYHLPRICTVCRLLYLPRTISHGKIFVTHLLGESLQHEICSRLLCINLFLLSDLRLYFALNCMRVTVISMLLQMK